MNIHPEIEEGKAIEFRRVRVDKIMFQKEDWMTFAFTVLEGSHLYKNKTYKGHGKVTIDTNTHFEMMAVGECHPNYGDQYNVLAAFPALPSERAGVLKFLKRHFSGVGEKKALQLVEAFGTDLASSMDNIDAVRETLSNQLHWSAEQTNKFCVEWQHKKPPVRSEMLLLACNVTARQIETIKRAYPSAIDLAAIIEQNPYKLMGLGGIGFKTVDRIAHMQPGFNLNSPTRIWAGIGETLYQESVKRGHCWTRTADLVKEAGKLLEMREPVIGRQLESNECPMAQIILRDKENDWWYRSIFDAESKVAEKIIALQSTVNTLAHHVTPGMLRYVAEDFAVEQGIRLSTEQEEALFRFLQEKVTILTGGPGTGKTTILKSLLHLLARLDVEEYYLCAPTGKAAKRIEESCQSEAYTIHRLLGIGRGDDGGGEHNSQNPLPAKVIIVDESSMIDVILMAKLVDSLKESTHLILIGDANQLPSVSAGKVFRDMVESKRINTITLNQVHRQAEASRITKSAHNINKGDYPIFDDDRDMWLKTADSPVRAREILIDLVANNLPKLGFAPEEIRVLTPFNKGDAGVEDLNKIIQELVNPPSDSKNEVLWKGVTLREGDRLIWSANNYELELMNGEDLRVVQIVSYGGDPSITLRVETGDEQRLISVPLSMITAKHGFAGTIHKGQGSEYPCTIVMALGHRTHHYTRQLLYTAVTRAKKLCIVIGTERSVRTIIANDNDEKRRTKLIRRFLPR